MFKVTKSLWIIFEIDFLEVVIEQLRLLPVTQAGPLSWNRTTEVSLECPTPSQEH